MKRLLSIVIIIGIIAYIAVQFLKDRRYNPPSDYDYEISEAIDKEYYDPLVIKEYYRIALEVGSYARSMWFNEKIDVRSIDKAKQKSPEATEYYLQLVASAKFLEDRLTLSKQYRDQGYSKDQVQLLMEQGITPEELKFQEKSYLLTLAIGSNGAEVWELQRMLNQHGDSIPEDGLFNLITRNRLRDYQRQNDLFPSGRVDENTLRALLKD